MLDATFTQHRSALQTPAISSISFFTLYLTAAYYCNERNSIVFEPLRLKNLTFITVRISPAIKNCWIVYIRSSAKILVQSDALRTVSVERLLRLILCKNGLSLRISISTQVLIFLHMQAASPRVILNYSFQSKDLSGCAAQSVLRISVWVS